VALSNAGAGFVFAAEVLSLAAVASAAAVDSGSDADTASDADTDVGLLAVTGDFLFWS